MCTISHHLLNSAIIHNCSDGLTNLQDLENSKKRKILDRCGQFEDESGDGSNICKIHLEALTTKFNQHSNCVAENHDKNKSRRIRGKDLNNAEKISPALSKHVQSVNGFVLPVGGKICAKCRRELSITIPLPNPQPNKRKLVEIPPPQTAPLPKRQKVETKLSMDFVVYGLSKKLKKTKYCDINNQEVIFPSIKVEHSPIKQSQMSDTTDPLLIDKIKEEICEENEATPIQDYSEVYIKQGEFGALEYQNEKENERVDLEIKEEPINH